MEALKGLYHADKLDEQSFIKNFTIRIKEFRSIISNLLQQKKKPLQHFLITGKRGMGKSTLLRRIYIEASKPPLSEKLLAVRLGAEQYRLSRLFKLWEMVLEHLGNDEPALLKQKKDLENSNHYEESLVFIVIDYLTGTDKTLLLLIDNFDQFIEKIPLKDQHALREVLIQYPIQIIGNTVFYNDHFKSYNQPFFDFFKPIHLNNLDREEAEEFIKLRAIGEGIDNFEEIYKYQKGKITALRILSGGVPRTLLILLSIVSKKNTGDTVDYLHEMIEQVTPLYQDRMKALSAQQQEIMHNLAIKWDKTPVKDLAAEMRIPSKSISAQLVQLEKNGYIKRVDVPGRNHYYEIDERFFNIWLLMSEAAPYDTKRVLWLTKWLDAFYSNDELKGFAKFCQIELKEIKPGNRFLIVQALSESQRLGHEYKKQLINETLEDLKDKMSEVKIWAENYNKKLTEEEILLKNEIVRLIEKQDFEYALKRLNILKNFDEVSALNGKAYVYLRKKNIDNAEKCLLTAVKKGNSDAMVSLGNLYKNEKKDIAGAEKYYLMAVEQGDTKAMVNLGYLYKNEKKDLIKAEKYYLMAAEKGDTKAMVNLGSLYRTDKKDMAEAEKYYLMAAEKGDSDAMISLGYLYKNEKMDMPGAEKYYLMAVEKGNSDAMAILGIFYENEKKDIAGAEKYYLMAMENGKSEAMGNLANLYFESNNISQKSKAFELSGKSVELSNYSNIILLVIHIGILLWNEKATEASKLMTDVLNGSLHTDDNMVNISEALQYFLVFKQKQFLYKLFSSNTEWIDRYKPVYYALLQEMQDEYLKEYLKMTSELEEPVKAIHDFVIKERKRLGI